MLVFIQQQQQVVPHEENAVVVVSVAVFEVFNHQIINFDSLDIILVKLKLGKGVRKQDFPLVIFNVIQQFKTCLNDEVLNCCNSIHI